MYLIDNCGSIFGEKTLLLFGDLNEQKVRQDSSTDSDSMHSYLSTQDSGSNVVHKSDDVEGQNLMVEA
jgi:hypothetical protein